ncbi:MAG: hypothetical protein ABSG64_10955 [Solirubrobacteraceae bacterium]
MTERRPGVWLVRALAGAGGAIVAVAIGSLLIGAACAAGEGAGGGRWSAPGTLASCGAASQPKVVFPLRSPRARSGEGAIVWLGPVLGGAGGCRAGGSGAGAGARLTVDVAGLHGDDLPAVPRALLYGAALRVGMVGPLAVSGTTRGQIVVIVGSRSAHVLGSSEAMLGDAPAAKGAGSVVPLDGANSVVATANGTIGDADVATVVPGAGGGEAIELLAQRHYAHRFGRALLIPIGAGPVTALALGMDYRADRIVVWVQGGYVWACWVTNHGRISPTQRLGPSGYDAQISAALSDDNRAFVAWTDEPSPGAGDVARVYLDHSAAEVVFGQPTVIARFAEPLGVRLSAGSIALERLASDGLAIVWPTMIGGRFAVRVAGLGSTRMQAPSTLSRPGEEVRLGAAATGPDGELLVLLEVAPRGANAGFEAAKQAIFAVRSHQNGAALGVGALERVAPAGSNYGPSVAIDPDTDRAVAVWQTLVHGVPSVAWSVRGGG